ncbi:MAG: hypothetical protein A2W22_06820 [Candidatus Levybacteria bacterium RBG_16_35_11]|nr:MAG: hypothetical protein A2W22_06820 [Candidatus Levybacteria bacterium RBG_16_35_11]
MKRSLNQDALREIYKQYKNYLMPLGIMVVSLLLFFYIIIPQIANFTDLQKQLVMENQKLTVLKTNLNYLSSLDASSLDSNFKIASLVLPKEKDFIGILGAISEAAGKASVSVGDYQFKVGDLEGARITAKGPPFLDMDLAINGSSSDLMRFMGELQKTAPINEVIGGATVGITSTLTIRFYYSAIPPVNLKADTAIKPISADNQIILNNLLSWNNLMQTLPVLTQSTVSGSFNSLGPFQ